MYISKSLFIRDTVSNGPRLHLGTRLEVESNVFNIFLTKDTVLQIVIAFFDSAYFLCALAAPRYRSGTRQLLPSRGIRCSSEIKESC